MVQKCLKNKDTYAGRINPLIRRQSTFEWSDSMFYHRLLLHRIVLMIAWENNLFIPFQKIFTFAKSIAIIWGFRGQEEDATFILSPRLFHLLAFHFEFPTFRSPFVLCIEELHFTAWNDFTVLCFCMTFP